MVKFFVTGDNHFGKSYARYSNIKDKLIKSRFDSLDRMVKAAEEMACEVFVITGDLFDNINTIKVGDVNEVVDILSAFNGTVLVLPGNHDYYTGDEKVWKDFENALSRKNHNIIVLNKYQEYTFDLSEDTVTVYPAFCNSKHSPENNLSWIKQSEISDKDRINIGIAHGAIKGVTPDLKEEYFLMSEAELNAIPVDAWFIGHTHIPYPNCLSEDKAVSGYKIFNAGTHEQTDLHNNTEGNAFVITVEKNDGIAKVSARKYVSGQIRYYDIDITVKPTDENALKDSIEKAIENISENSIVRLNIKGSVKECEYQEKKSIYTSLLSGMLTYEVNDKDLSEEITIEKIRYDYAETSFAAKFLEELVDNATELQMVYDLLKDCKE